MSEPQPHPPQEPSYPMPGGQHEHHDEGADRRSATQATMDPLKIQFPSLMENIRIVESFIDNSRERFDIDDDVYGNILVSVTEAVNNAIQHGNNLDKNKNVTLTLHHDDGQLKFSVTDEGPGFDYNNLPDPTAPENINKPNGRGIFLIRHLADKVDFSQEGTTITLTFDLV